MGQPYERRAESTIKFNVKVSFCKSQSVNGEVNPEPDTVVIVSRKIKMFPEQTATMLPN